MNRILHKLQSVWLYFLSCRGEELSSGDSEDDIDAFSENSEDSLDALGADFDSESDEGVYRIPTALITP